MKKEIEPVKKTIRLMIFAVVLAMLFVSLCSCGGGQKDFAGVIKFKERYVCVDSDGNRVRSYLFYKDGTGEYEIYSQSSSFGVTAGTVIFEWRQASDGAVYLFEKETRRHEDDTLGYGLGMASAPIVFEKDFITYTVHSQYGASNHQFIRENSTLAKAVE